MLDKLNWRYAAKKMDPAKPVADDKLEQIIEAVRMAPTSSGLQPYHLIAVKDPAVRAKLREAAYDQAQLTDGSMVLVFAAWDNYSDALIDDVVADHGAKRGGVSDMLTGYYDRLKGMYLPRTEDVNHNHAARQAYIGLGFALAAAAELGVDSTPMEGFEPAKFDEILGLTQKGLKSVVILALGTRDPEGDWLLPQAKVRRDRAQFVTEI
ncbi:Putative NAD(P)H nitroreductase YfkO [Aquimixticola soesokkakensis]|uniref:Putative NAD(P)H nitroreductase YfkO n=1 Tax=Aquimixticola soesokkakensis TaxID=1519096 RepID=A0A1Y5TAN4_9RHOB|nr:nitroreductase family protein [Aquimixticola soesokkakensis]SLN59248.1 Putative NAD(P)H nitroreductase YfkO [Aquimixticola soesokkakensis]